MRLFAGVSLSDEARRALSDLTRPALPGVRWTTAGQWHVTLAFFGEVDGALTDALASELGAAATALDGPVEAVLGPATRLLGRSVLAVPVAGLDVAASVVRAAAGAVGVAAGEARPFHGHVSVARGRGGRPVPVALSGVAVSARWRVEAIELVRSHLGPDGARYETLARATVWG